MTTREDGKKNILSRVGPPAVSTGEGLLVCMRALVADAVLAALEYLLAVGACVMAPLATDATDAAGYFVTNNCRRCMYNDRGHSQRDWLKGPRLCLLWTRL